MPVLPDPFSSQSQSLEDVKRVILCTGKLYYDLLKKRDSLDLSTKVHIIRIEELAPFPGRPLMSALEPYNGVEVVWVQEEPRNQGAWGFVEGRIDRVLQALGLGGRVIYVGRREEAVPAPGVGALYRKQQEKVLQDAFEDV